MSLEIGAGGPAEESSFREKRRTHFVRVKSVRVICRTNIRHIHDPVSDILYWKRLFSRRNRTTYDESRKLDDRGKTLPR